jgi:hypothetical protein
MATDGSTLVDISSRASTSSVRSSGSRRQNPQQQLSQIEKSVTHLLVATKQLLETLTQWSRGSATEAEVSDVYVRLGYEFNIACRAFNAIGVETQDLGPVPDLLRGILEDTLSQEASQASLDRFLPRIRDIIINLLQGLKKKQSKLRARSARDLDQPNTERQSTYEEGLSAPSASRGSISRQGGIRERSINDLPPRTTSRQDGRASPSMHEGGQVRPDRHDNRNTLGSSDSSMSSNTAQSLPVTAPYPPEDSMPGPQPQPPAHANFPGPPPPPPPPPPKQQDAMLALQRGGELERRASRRFSTYQINKQLGGAASGIVIPPTQNGPVPNRGREVRESLQAVRQRGSQLYNRQKSERRLAGEESPQRATASRISEASEENNTSGYQLEENLPQGVTEPPENVTELEGIEIPAFSATVSGPSDDPVTADSPATTIHVPARQSSRRRRAEASPPTTQPFNPEESPQPGKELTLFLQFKSKIKKFVLEDGYNDLSIARLQLAFIDKFAWNTHSNGLDLPEIYIQDTVSGVRYELEDLNDIKNNSVLVLNFEPLDEVKRHIDDGIGGLRRVVEGIKTAVENQESAIHRIGDRQHETQKELANIATTPLATRGPMQSANGIVLSSSKFGSSELGEIESLRRNLAVMRQSYSSLVSDVEASMAAVRTKAKSVKSAAITAGLPTLSGESGRAYIKAGLFGTLAKEQSSILERVDDVQDSIEDLRKDVVLRGVRPLPRQLEQVAKDLSNSTADLKKLEAYVAKEMPLWSKIWKQELQQVCDDREAIGETEALIADMKLDLEESEKTFRLVEEACKQQNAMGAAGTITPGNAMAGSIRAGSSGSARVPALVVNSDPLQGKDGLLVEVQGLHVDHESRLEAIERAERVRQKELESRSEGTFKKELGSFVGEGKLKKSGGVEEAERLRKVKDDRIRREVWERLNNRGKTNDEVAAAAAAAAADKQSGGGESFHTPPEKSRSPVSGAGSDLASSPPS